MRSLVRKSLSLMLVAGLFCLLGAFQRQVFGADAKEAIGIKILSVPTDAPGEAMAKTPIKGSVSGIDPGDYKVVVYAYGDKWYVQPTAANPLISINADKTWESNTHGGTDFCALLVKKTYKAAATLDALPKVEGDVIAKSDNVQPK